MPRGQSDPQLTSRDSAILQLVADLNGCGVDHIQRRLWSGTLGSSSCYRRIAALSRVHYLHTERLPSYSGVGSGKALIRLGYKGRRLLSSSKDPHRVIQPNGGIGTFFARHHFAICDFRIALEREIEQLKDPSLVDWVSEQTLRREGIGVLAPLRASTHLPVRRGKVVPDGAFTLNRAGVHQAFLFEQDQGTMSTKRLHQKLRAYMELQIESGLRLPVLFVVPNLSRTVRLQAVAVTEAKKLTADPSAVFVTTSNEVDRGRILTRAVWFRAGSSNRVRLLN